MMKFQVRLGTFIEVLEEGDTFSEPTGKKVQKINEDLEILVN